MSETVTISTENLRTFMGRIIPLLDERSRHLFAGATTDMLGRGGQKLVNEITGLSRVTIIKVPRFALRPKGPKDGPGAVPYPNPRRR